MRLEDGPFLILPTPKMNECYCKKKTTSKINLAFRPLVSGGYVNFRGRTVRITSIYCWYMDPLQNTFCFLFPAMFAFISPPPKHEFYFLWEGIFSRALLSIHEEIFLKCMPWTEEFFSSSQDADSWSPPGWHGDSKPSFPTIASGGARATPNIPTFERAIQKNTNSMRLA